MTGGTFSKEEIARVQSKFRDEKGSFYEGKKSNWSKQDLPAEFLSFVFCGFPGKALPSVCVTVEPAVIPASHEGRAQMVRRANGKENVKLETRAPARILRIR